LLNKVIKKPEYNGYYVYNGSPVMLLGGARQENLLDLPDMVRHMEQLSECGGNFVRCTLPSVENAEYQAKLKLLLDTCLRLGIIVSMNEGFENIVKHYPNIVYDADAALVRGSGRGVDAAVKEFWESMLRGKPAVRFAPPPQGIGLDQTAQRHIRSARIFLESYDIFTSKPLTEGVARNDAGDIAVFCIKPQTFRMDMLDPDEFYHIYWLDIVSGNVMRESLSGQDKKAVTTMFGGLQIGIVKKA